MEHNTNHNHDAFLEKPLWDEHPKDVVNEGTAKKNCTNLIQETIKPYNMSNLGPIQMAASF